MLNEISTNRLLKHFQDENTLAIISSYRTERIDDENRKLLNKLKNSVKNMKLGFSEVISRWSETNLETKQIESSDERSLIIYGISLKQAIEFGKEFLQSSIIFKDKDKCAEVCTIEFIDYEGDSHKEGDIVRIFNVTSKKPFNLADAKDIFEKRKGGPASFPVKSNRAFTLTEMFEVEHPHGSIFSAGKERYFKIF